MSQIDPTGSEEDEWVMRRLMAARSLLSHTIVVKMDKKDVDMQE